MPVPSTILFLPGASGHKAFWNPVMDRLVCPARKIHRQWPGFADTPSVPEIHSLEDLAGKVIEEITQPTAMVAQSMGGVVAVMAALRCLKYITHLVLTATSGGVNMAGTGAVDWRPEFVRNNPRFPDWFVRDKTDLTTNLESITIPVLLLWGDNDPISPVAVGERLALMLPNAVLYIIKGGKHDLAITHAGDIAPLIAAHLGF